MGNSMTASQGQKVEGPLANRWIWLALLASVAINLLVLGAMASAMLFAPKENWPTRGGFARSLVSYERTLPAERRAAIHPLIEEARTQFRPLRRTLRDHSNQIARLALSEPFDKARFEAEMAKLLSAETDMRRATQARIGDILALLTAEERKKLVEWHEERNRRGTRSRRRGSNNSENTGSEQK